MDLEASGGLIWTKNRDTTDSYAIIDSIRGIATSGSKYIASNRTDAEASSTNMPSSLEANGYFLQGSGGRTNTNNESYVSWIWKAGGDAVSNTDGTITSQVSANTEAGFSIVKWTGDSTSDPTVGHGLNQEPDIYIVKQLDNGTLSWLVGGNSTLFPETATKASFLRLNTTDDIDQTPLEDFGNSGNNLIKVGARTSNGQDSIAYCWHSVTGYSRIDSYEGLGTSDVSVSGLGFKPSFIMVKNADANSNWNIYDTARGSIENRMNNLLYPNLAQTESGVAATMYITVNDDGFVVNNANHLQLNYSGDTFIYMAFK